MIKVGIVSIIDTIDPCSDIEDYFLKGDTLHIVAWCGDGKVTHKINCDEIAEMYGRTFVKWLTETNGAPDAIIMK
jgi:hypothetical protein